MSFTQILSNLTSPLFKAVDWLRSFFNTIWGWIISFLALLFAPLKWAIDTAVYWIGYLTTQIDTLTEKIQMFWDNLATAWAPVASTMATANMIFPLSHVFYVMSLLLLLWGIAILYRFIKSLIPTVA